ncbi:uncharacterized protein LOC132064638 isoform X2 [Lycium ferocissimum]|uniref:uncharacterized protein LOC132064638 isoform X2 n=1 Tax=Lycium ferocissimum TaxID=112874 RepID=UPI0028168F1E|nr:uncharacterized protein LOC132064638 isoform X2 [Lycium ferocissimum]
MKRTTTGYNKQVSHSRRKYLPTVLYIFTPDRTKRHREKQKSTSKNMEKKMMTVAAMAMVFMILLSANMDIVDAQGVNCYDNCNTGCAGLPSKEYLRCDKKCHKRCGDGKIDGNLG